MSGESKIVRTVSPRAGYGADVMRAHVEDGRLVRVEGDPEDRAGRGKLSPFAQRYVERVYSKERLLRPHGKNGDGKLVPISWDEAYDRIAENLTTIATESDPRALLYYAAHGQDGVMTQFANLFLSYYGGYSTVFGDLCRTAGMEATRLTLGALHHHPPEDYANAGLVVIWGKNPAVTNPHQMTFLEEARAAGTLLWCIDPLRTKTARAADEHIAPRPGTDGFLANAMAHVLIEEELYDRAFVEKHVLGFEDYRWMVRNYEPKKAQDACGLDAEFVTDLARRFAAARPVNVNAGFGVQRYRNGGQTVRALASLQAIAGNIGVAGGGFDYFNQAGFVTRPYPFKIAAPPRVRQLGAVSRLGRVVLGATEPPVRAAIIERANPMTQVPFTSAVHYALDRLDFVCVIDQFLTDTALRADIVLPAKTMFEETDIHPGLWHGILHLKRKCIEPPGEVRTERDLYRGLAERMGYPTDQFELEPEDLLDQVLPAGLSVNRLRKQAFDRRGAEWIPFSDRRFPTPSGQVELRSETAEVSWRVNPLPFYAPPRESREADAERARRFPLHLLTPKSEHRFCSQWAHDAELRQELGEPAVRMHPSELKKRKIGAGGRVRVFNDRGEVKVAAQADENVPPGLAVVEQGRWIEADGFSVNVLTHDDVTDLGYGSIVFDCLVQVESVD